MENILGVVIFIVFIALRAMGDRKKGMKKEPDQKNAQQPEPGRTATRPLAPPRAQKPVRPAAAPVKKAVEKAVPARKAPEPVRASGGKKPAPSPQPVSLDEGMSAYDKLQPMEGVSNYESLPIMEGITELPLEENPILKEFEEEMPAAAVFVDPEEIRKAIVWSEVLQKPKFKSKYSGYRKIS